MEKRQAFDIGIIGGFGDKGNSLGGLERMFEKEFSPQKSFVHVSTPFLKALKHPIAIADETERILEKEMISKEILLVGTSYGALIALLVACRREMKNILGLILIDGPISPHEQVPPAHVYQFVFLRQYFYRQKIAQECEKMIEQMETSRIVTIGSQEDNIVPPLAKRLRGNFQDVILTDSRDFSSLDSRSIDSTKGINIFLPYTPLYRGHGLGRKVRIVTAIVRKLFFISIPFSSSLLP